jgi:hypothetical protein
MKKVLILGGLLLALNSYSQSYLILNNGVALTLDKSAFIYDFGHFVLPYKVNFNAGTFFAEDEKFISIDEQGFLYRKDEKIPKKIKGKGNNYVIAENGVIYTFDAAGFFYKFEKDSAIKKAHAFGGNFFTVKPDDKKLSLDLYTVNSQGNYFKLNVPGLNPVDIATYGGNFFKTRQGTLYTVSKEGFVFSKAETKVGIIRKTGGNYFIDSSNSLFTISEAGYLNLPVLPANIKVADIEKFGTNYMIDKAGRIFVVDSTGNIHQREYSAHDLTQAKILSL